jgi:hypothetical protein
MNRRLILVAVGSFVAGGAWSVVGNAQNAPIRINPNRFHITVEVPKGSARVWCDSGCDWPNNANEGVLLCEQERCKFAFTQSGRVLFGELDAR